MKILVTGTAGFIGFHFAKALLEDGHEVVGIDNFNDYYDVRLKKARHRLLENYPLYTGHALELCDGEALDDLVQSSRIERIVHLAAQAGVRYSLTHPHVYEQSNLQAFLNVLETCRHRNIERLVYASSSSVYGGNTKLPFAETDPVDHPVSLYAATKKANELMAHTYTHLYGFQTVGLRFFTVYGPWGRPDMALWLFTEAMFEGRPIKVFNHGDMKRDFTYIDDIVTGVKASVLKDGLEAYEILNLGNHRAEHLMDMIHILAETIGVEPQMELLPMQDGDVPATYADVQRAHEKLGFQPTTSIREGIPKFVDWFRTYRDEGSA